MLNPSRKKRRPFVTLNPITEEEGRDTMVKDETWNHIQRQAKEWERKGWLHKFRDQAGVEYWELTPLGRKELDLPTLVTQAQ